MQSHIQTSSYGKLLSLFNTKSSLTLFFVFLIIRIIKLQNDAAWFSEGLLHKNLKKKTAGLITIGITKYPTDSLLFCSHYCDSNIIHSNFLCFFSLKSIRYCFSLSLFRLCFSIQFTVAFLSSCRFISSIKITK